MDAVLRLDEDDRLSLPTQIRAQEVDDHAIYMGGVLTLHGREMEIEDC
jgi:hypothetical protein